MGSAETIRFSVEGHNCSNKGHKISPNLGAKSFTKSTSGDWDGVQDLAEFIGTSLSNGIGAQYHLVPDFRITSYPIGVVAVVFG